MNTFLASTVSSGFSLKCADWALSPICQYPYPHCPHPWHSSALIAADFGSDRAKWVARDWQDNPSRVAVTSFDVIPVNDPPYIYKSDLIVPLTILASDVDEAELHVSAKHTKDGGLEKDGLPTGLFL